MDTNLREIRAIQVEMKEEIKSGQEEMRSTLSAIQEKMDAWIAEMRACRKEMMGC
jgi:hypothetical protein